MLSLWLVVLLIPLLDGLVLVAVATQVLGLVPTVALTVLTALLGTFFVRAEGRRTLSKVRTALQRGEVPTDELIDGALLIAAGAMFLTPGVVTDGIALLLAFPPTRAPARWYLKRYVITPYIDARTGGLASGEAYTGGFPDDRDTVDVDFEEVED
ncbi:membrane protein FxsA [Halobacteriales archaeon SW_7_68_16]|nr:MAG: membrane protein FxsA [Halobacteriales archaeon SW_7_68_16]